MHFIEELAKQIRSRGPNEQEWVGGRVGADAIPALETEVDSPQEE